MSVSSIPSIQNIHLPNVQQIQNNAHAPIDNDGDADDHGGPADNDSVNSAHAVDIKA